MPGLRSSTMAMMCRTRLICRLPARESRCLTWSPEDASMGAVPVQDAKWSLFGNRVMSPTSTNSRAARGADPGQVQQVGAGGPDEVGELLVGGLLALVGPLEVADQFGGDSAATLPAASRGRVLARIALACAAERYCFAPPGTSSRSRWCS